MKRFICSVFIFIMVLCFTARAQEPYFIFDNDSILSDVTEERVNAPIPTPTNILLEDSIPSPDMYGWKIDPRSGARTFYNTEHSFHNFHQHTLMDGKSIAVAYLGNWGSPAQSRLFFEREESSQFTFLDPFRYYYKKPEDHIFLNTKVPYSNIFYQSGGGRLNKEERFVTHMSINSNKRLNIGFDIDYVYSRGFYDYLSNKQISYDVYASYIGDRYKMHAFVANNYYNNSENGGIANDLYITDPDNESLTNVTSSKDIPVRLQYLWNKLKGRQLFMKNQYDLGYEETLGDGEEQIQRFIPVTSFILTTRYADQSRRIGARNNNAIDTLYTNNFYDSTEPINDYFAYWSFKNTFAISVNEGFKEWVKFGLTAFVEQDFRKFSMPSKLESLQADTVLIPNTNTRFSESSTVIGGILSKQQGEFLRYNLRADLGVLGYNLGEFRIEGDASTTIKFAGKDAQASVKAYIKNLKPTFFENKYRSKYYLWENNFSDIRRVFVGGEIIIPHTLTRLSGGVENIQNHIYYGPDGNVAQEGKNVQVITLRLDQNLKAGIFHWDNQIAYQATSNSDVIPLPELSLYTNVYLETIIAKVLSIQLGADAHFFTDYYSVGYDPITLQFYNQRQKKIGGFPITTAYMNLDLKKTRFFLMMYNITQDMGDSNYFSLPHYPFNQMFFKFGFSWDFSN